MMMLLAAMLFVSCSSEENEVMAQTRQEKLYITIDGMTKTATMVDNAATQELVARQQQASIATNRCFLNSIYISFFFKGGNGQQIPFPRCENIVTSFASPRPFLRDGCTRQAA